MKTTEELVEEIRQMYRAQGKEIEIAYETMSTPHDQNADGVRVETSYAVYRGFATYYGGSMTASGAKFDKNSMAAAMTKEKVPVFGTSVTVEHVAKDGPVNIITVVVNDRGPFLRDKEGKAVIPYQPSPEGVIDLTEAAFVKLAGTSKIGKIPVTVRVPR